MLLKIISTCDNYLHKNMNKLFAVFVSLILYVLADGDAPELSIPQGVLRGKYEKTWKGRQISSFTGIPYAKPPVGELRFEHPVPAEPWEGILDASKLQAMCPQPPRPYTNLNEDCLYINVHVPEKTHGVHSKLLPVMFYIHGGGFSTGSSDFYPPDYLLDKDIILVTMNYRLGALGFFSSGDDVVPGNNGLKDQNLALKWTIENIQHFGGNPNQITMFGESAGACSTHLHTVSPRSRDLFHGAAFNSGAGLSAWAVSTKGETFNNSLALAKLLNCPTAPSRDMVECLKKISDMDIIAQHDKYLEALGDLDMVPFKPVIEPPSEMAFLSEDPFEIVASGKAADIPMLTGINREDGCYISATSYNNESFVQGLNHEFYRLAPILFSYRLTAPDPDSVSEEIRSFYFQDKEIDNSAYSKDTFTKMCTDGMFFQGQDAVAELHRRYYTQPLYYYLLGFQGSASLASLLTKDTSFNYGVCHSDDLFYLFKYFRIIKDFGMSEDDKKMIDFMVTLYTNFVITGNPSPQTDNIVKTKWHPAKSERLEYYFIKGPSNASMEVDLEKKRRNFWRNVQMDPRREIVKRGLPINGIRQLTRHNLRNLIERFIH